ncbi:MAG TPA: (d)CMP kinase [Steroidobacteraceae bacterium]|jgi:cytidylate kinase|nr:(d)CMP kinase [Steroidobacteraceae bacterium]
MSLPGVPIITVDGPSGSGKGTVSRAVAKSLGWALLDSGALYRLVALAGRRASIDLDDAPALEQLARRFNIRFGSDGAGEEAVWLDGQDVTRAIRTEQAGNDASKVAALPQVRAALLERQRRFAVAPGLVADGRDMGTVVFPHARVKIFLTASPSERASRRHKQLKEKGVTANLAALSLEIAERDQRDMSRASSPLVASADATMLDTTGMSVDDVIERVLTIARDLI